MRSQNLKDGSENRVYQEAICWKSSQAANEILETRSTMETLVYYDKGAIVIVQKQRRVEGMKVSTWR
jgi:hypothetical protein